MPDCRSLPRYAVDTSISACKPQTDSQKIESEVPVGHGSLTGIVIGCQLEPRSKLTARFESKAQQWSRVFETGPSVAARKAP